MKFKKLHEKATSVAQQKLMALALQHKRGKLDADKVTPAVEKLAKSMSEKELDDFASTKHKGLPQKKEDSEVSNRSAALKPQMYNDPNTGKKKVRMVPAKSNIAKTNDPEAVKESYTDKQDASYRDRRTPKGAQKRLKALNKKALAYRKKHGKFSSDPYSVAKKYKMDLKFESVEEAHDPKHVKMAIGVASDKRYKQGNYSGAVRAIEKIKKGLSKHPQVAAVLKRQNEAKDPNEYDNEGEMAKTQLKTIMRNAEEMMELLDDEENMPEWVQNKITKASDYMTSAYNYMASEEDDEVQESVNEVGFQGAAATATRVAALGAIGGAAYAAKKARDRFDPVKVAKARREREERKKERQQAQKEIDNRKRQRARNKPARRPAG